MPGTPGILDIASGRTKVVPVESARTATQCSSPALGGLIVKIRYKYGDAHKTGFVVDFSAFNLFVCEEYKDATAYDPAETETLLRLLQENGDSIKVSRMGES